VRSGARLSPPEQRRRLAVDKTEWVKVGGGDSASLAIGRVGALAWLFRLPESVIDTILADHAAAARVRELEKGLDRALEEFDTIRRLTNWHDDDLKDATRLADEAYSVVAYYKAPTPKTEDRS
jgi:hypothetical protein